MADDSALVVVGPDDTVDAIIQKVRGAGTRSVELLVAEGAPALQVIGGLSRLRSAAAEANVDLLLITSDTKTLNAARLCQVEAMSVQGVPVVAPPPPSAAPINPYSTRQLPAVDLGSDDELLRALDEETRPSRRPPASSPVSDDDILAALDDLSDLPASPPDQQRGGRDRHTPVYRDEDERYAAELDSWGDLSTDNDYAVVDPRNTQAPAPVYEQPTRRVRPEDIDLTDDDLRGSDRRERARERDRERRAESRRVAAPVMDEPRRPRRTPYDDEGYGRAAPARRASNPLLTWIPVLLILLLAGIGAYWLYTNRATVIVRPPVPASEQVPFDEMVVPLSQEPVAEDSPAVQAVKVSAPVEYKVNGTISEETLTPRNFAKGIVTVLNSARTPAELPQGTEFIATNSQGQEVRFVSDGPVTVPPATESDNGAQIVIQRGSAQVGVTARQPGTASNVDANTIKQIAFPGQAPVPASGGGLLVSNEPLTGGDEQPIRVVTDGAVQQVLEQALTGLYEQGLTTLREQANTNGGTWKLEQTTVAPRPEELSRIGDGQIFELQVSPEVGQEVPNDNPTFTVTVRAAFNALAVPEERPLPKQLETAVPRQLVQSGLFKPGLAPTINGWRWDGDRLLVSGVLSPTQTQGTIDAATRSALLESLRGKSRADAIAILEDYKQRGVIGDYTLPDRDPLPSLSFQLDLQVE